MVGRPKGLPKTGGRKVGSVNKSVIEKAYTPVPAGMSPLEFMLTVMCDETKELPIRMDAAKSAARYIHPSLTAITHSGKIGTDFDLMDVHQIQAWIAQRVPALLPARDDGETTH